MEMIINRTEEFKEFKQNCNKIKADIIRIENDFREAVLNAQFDGKEEEAKGKIWAMMVMEENSVFVSSKYQKLLDLKFSNLTWFIEFELLEEQLVNLWENEKIIFSINSFLKISVSNLHSGLFTSLLNSNETLKKNYNGVNTNQIAIDLRNFKRREMDSKSKMKEFDQLFGGILSENQVSIDDVIKILSGPKNEIIRDLKLFSSNPNLKSPRPNSRDVLIELFDLLKLICPDKTFLSESDYDILDKAGYDSYRDYKIRTLQKIFAL